MRMNMGSAASAHELELLHRVVARIGPIGAGDRASMASAPVAMSANATHTPVESMAMSATSSPPVMAISLIRRLLPAARCLRRGRSLA